MNPKKIGSLILLGILGLGMLAVLSANAYTGVGLFQTGHTACGAYNCTKAFASNVGAGDTIVVFTAGAYYTPNTAQPHAPTDTSSDTFTLQAFAWCINGGGTSSADCSGKNGIWIMAWTTSSAGGAETITLDSSYGAGVTQLSIFDLVGFGTTPSCSSVGTSNGVNSQASQTTTSCNASGTFIMIAGIGTTAATPNSYVATSGFTKQQDDTTDAGAPMVEYSTSPSSATIPSNFPITWNTSSGWDTLGVTFISNASSFTASQSIGSCPSKDTSTFTMANLTIYFYSGTSLGSSSAASASTFLASITGSVSQTLYLAIYVTPVAGGVSVSNPLTRIGYQSFTISPSSKNQQINWNTALTSMAAGATWAVGVSGDNKLVLNQSTTSGVTSQTFITNFVGGAGSFSSLGSASTNLYLCATANFQSILTTTTTTTQPGTSTIFTTSTATSIDQNAAASTTVGFSILVIIILGPAMILGGVMGAVTRNAGLAMIGFIAGLTVGAGLGNYAGLVPVQWLFITVVLDLLLVFGLLRFGNSGG